MALAINLARHVTYFYFFAPSLSEATNTDEICEVWVGHESSSVPAIFQPRCPWRRGVCGERAGLTARKSGGRPTRRPCACPFPLRGRMPIAPRVGAASDRGTSAGTAIGQDFAVCDISRALRSTNEGRKCRTVSIVEAPRRIPIAGFRDKLPVIPIDDREP